MDTKVTTAVSQVKFLLIPAMELPKHQSAAT